MANIKLIIILIIFGVNIFFSYISFTFSII